ncbi:unnamed protein product, partial [Scytosiphon promiscuus]
RDQTQPLSESPLGCSAELRGFPLVPYCTAYTLPKSSLQGGFTNIREACFFFLFCLESWQGGQFNLLPATREQRARAGGGRVRWAPRRWLMQNPEDCPSRSTSPF